MGFWDNYHFRYCYGDPETETVVLREKPKMVRSLTGGPDVDKDKVSTVKECDLGSNL